MLIILSAKMSTTLFNSMPKRMRILRKVLDAQNFFMDVLQHKDILDPESHYWFYLRK